MPAPLAIAGLAALLPAVLGAGAVLALAEALFLLLLLVVLLPPPPALLPPQLLLVLQGPLARLRRPSLPRLLPEDCVPRRSVLCSG